MLSPSERISDSLSLGVDLGSQVLKFVLVDRGRPRIEIRGAGAIPLEPTWIQDGSVRDARRVARALSARSSEYGLQRSQAVVSIPSNLAFLRWVNLPQLSGEELRDAARYKVKRHLPFPVEHAYVQASPPQTEDDENIGQSLVIVVKREVVDSRAEALEQAGIRVVGAELEAQALLRVVERKLNEQSALWRDASLTIIDVGANNTHMYVVQNQKLQFIRGVKFGGRKLAEALAGEFNCTPEEADQLISQPDTNLTIDGMLHLRMGDLPAQIFAQPEIEKLTREFLRLLRYFRSLHPERSYAGILDHVLICGGLTSMQGFAEYLQNVLGIRVERAKPFAGMTGKYNRETFESITNRQEAFTVSMGLALSGLVGQQQSQGDTRARREFAWARSA